MTRRAYLVVAGVTLTVLTVDFIQACLKVSAEIQARKATPRGCESGCVCNCGQQGCSCHRPKAWIRPMPEQFRL